MEYEKAYKDALERARKAYNAIPPESRGARKIIEDAFPELRESEDERMRKLIMDRVRSATEMTEGLRELLLTYLEKQKDACLFCDQHLKGYLAGRKTTEEEKQKEQKPVDYDAELKKCKDNPLYFYDKYVKIKLKPSEWGEEDEKHLNNILDAIDYWETTSGQGILLDTDINWLKSLRPQPKPEWNAEDERMLSRCVKSIESSKQFADTDTFKKAKDNEIDWLENRLKSLRPSWKPSEEQIEALQHAIDACESEWAYQDDELRSLLNDIKKL